MSASVLLGPEGSSVSHHDLTHEVGSLGNLYLPLIDKHWWGIIIELLLFAYSFLGLAIICDEFLVISLETLCVRWMVREDVAGATFMAFGSAAPEIIVNAVTTFKSRADKKAVNLGVGAIVGSGVIAFSLIPGCCALLAHHELHLKRRPLLRDIVAYSTALGILCISFRNGFISSFESSLLLGTYVVYLCVIICSPHVRRRYRAHFHGHTTIARQRSFVEEREALLSEEDPLLDGNGAHADNGTLSSGDGRDDVPDGDDLMEESGKLGRFMVRVGEPLRKAMAFTCPDCERGKPNEGLYLVTFFVSFAWVALLSFILSTIVERWGKISEVPLSFFGFLLIAIGAEIPDLIQSVTVAKRGYGSMAVSNALGSQIINICIGLGFPWFLSTLGGEMIEVSEHWSINIAAILQGGTVFIVFSLLLGSALYHKSPKALLNKRKGALLVFWFVVVQVSYGLYVFVPKIHDGLKP